MFVADKIRGLEFVATALGGKITNRIESSKQSTEGRHKVVVIFLFVFGAKAQHFGYMYVRLPRCLGFITTIAVSNFTYLSVLPCTYMYVYMYARDP